MSLAAGGNFPDLSRLLNPGSIAVVGASDRPGNLGGETIRRLQKFGYPGPIWPINPSGARVAGLPCFTAVAETPAIADLAILAVPAAALVQAVETCIAAGIRNGIAYAGGLGEAGGQGAAMQARLVAACRDAGFNLCGPNCVGIINSATPVTSTFGTVLLEIDALRPGVISMVSQSGGIGTSLLGMAEEAGFGFRTMISSGNEAVVGFADYLHALALDEGTRVIAAYLEGVGDGPKLARALAEARRRRKPVVLIKAGATKTSARAAQAHTGSLVGEDRVVDAILQETGVIRVHGMEELLDTCLLLSSIPPDRMPTGAGVGVATFGGGSGVLAADQCAAVGLDMPALQPGCVARLQPLLVSVASAANPLDLTPATAFADESMARLPDAIDLLAAQPELNALVFIVGSLAVRANEIIGVIRTLYQSAAKPVVVSWPSPPKGVVARLADSGIPCFLDPARAIRALGRIVAWTGNVRPARSAEPASLSIDWAAHVADPVGRPVVSEDRCHALLRDAGLPVAAGELAHDAAAALRIAERLGLPVVLKGISAQVTHRAAAGLLAVDLRSRDEVAAAFAELEARARMIPASLDGIYVQKMERGGVELLVSAFRDPNFGTMVSCGSGGGLTELIDDVVTARAPVDVAFAADMIGRLRIARQAGDTHGPLDPGAAASFVAQFSQLAAGAPWQRFVFEVNPIKWRRDGVIAVDGLLIIEQP